MTSVNNNYTTNRASVIVPSSSKQRTVVTGIITYDGKLKVIFID